MADIFGVVADATRRELLQILLDRHVSAQTGSRDATVTELVNTLGISQPTVSKHLKVLRDASLVSVREDGQHRYYRLETAPLEALEDWLIPFLRADYESEQADVGSTVFAAWSGSALPRPLRKMADSIEHSADAGAAVGRTVADASHQMRTVIEDVASTMERRVIDPIKEKLGNRHPSDEE